MSNLFSKTIVRSIFLLTSRDRAISQAEGLLTKYINLANELSIDDGQRSIEVPPMRGVDEDMRKWSFFMILEHNAIVNRSISTTISQLVKNESLSGAAAIDPKKDVMPSMTAGKEQLRSFRFSDTDHLEMIKYMVTPLKAG